MFAMEFESWTVGKTCGGDEMEMQGSERKIKKIFCTVKFKVT